MFRIPRQVLVYLYRRRADGSPEYLLLKRRGHSEEWIFWQGVSGEPEGGQDPEFWDRLYAPGVESIHEEVYSAEVPADWEPALSTEHDSYRWCDLASALGLLKYEDNKKALITLDDRISS